MSELSKVKLVSGDRKKTQNGKGHVVKKIYRKVAEKQTDDIGKLSVNVGTNHATNAVTEAKPKIQQKALNAPKKAVKKLISQSVAKTPAQKPSTKKNMATKQPLIKIQKPHSNKKSPGVRNPNSTTVNKVETKKIKPVKRVLKAIPTIVSLPRDTTLHQEDGTKLTYPAEKQPVKVKRVLRKKLLSSLNGKTTKPKNVSSMAVDTVLPISNNAKMFPAMTKQI
ncbi:unnamed protein product [Macrosiphum euphorbiae]|uniref:Uncharacterized protein n=1 Tax=Macrosiphum euphorbiae TaxID=13131 RepID=A0AAV0W9I4_9HEMI|nr:unnamed protein product [Macrosiphum euphorbiae]CAI6359410.1 unnamed protein product [Macrosiphum euphorbiae]CAI6359867.1 unnamed protein product [Macrosiphum euphorbiae]